MDHAILHGKPFIDKGQIFPLRKIRMGSDRNFLFQFEPVIRNPEDKELKYFQRFLSGNADNTRSDLMLIFLSANRPLCRSCHAS